MDDLSQFAASVQALREPGIGASDVSGCYREAAYAYHHVPPDRVRSTDQADLGTLLHLGWSAMIRYQHRPDEREADVALVVEELPRPVRADDVDWLNLIVTDVKTARGAVWEGWLRRSGPPEGYWDQLEVYALALLRRTGEPWVMRVVAINRETGQRQEYTRAADPAVGLALVQRARGRHLALTASVAEGGVAEEFPREGKGPGRGAPCDYCDWVGTCWPPGDPDEGTSPQSETIKNDPALIEAALRDYNEASVAGGKFEDAKADARAFLAGLPPGRYGDYTLGWRGGRPLDPKPDCGAMEAYLVEHGIEVPMLPAGRSPKSISVLPA